MSETKWVYVFTEVDAAQERVGGDWEAVRALLGGKGANLGDMTRLGIPVPPGLTVTTEACLAFLEHDGAFPGGMWEQVLDAVREVEAQAGRTFGDPSNPLLLSVRSGARFSMPGMMDTILNVGLNDEVAERMVQATGLEHFVWDSYRRLVQMYGDVVLGVPSEVFEAVLKELRLERGVATDAELPADDLREATSTFRKLVEGYAGIPFPTDPHEQLRLATEAVFRSWNGRRAIDYRKAAGIADDLGTAVNIQTMVFGNLTADSATGVAMSRDAATGEDKPEGDFLLQAQGEDVVAGIRQTRPLEDLGGLMPEIYEQFLGIAKRLERHYRDMQDMEFTVEDGKLWLLQTRNGKRTAQAAVRIAVELAQEGLISPEEALSRVTPAQVDVFLHPQLEATARQEASPLATGLNVSPGAAVGQIALDADTAAAWAAEGRRVIMVRPETRPDDVHGMLAAEGIVTLRGGRTSHAALVARQFGKPAVVGVSELEIDVDQRAVVVEAEGITLAEGDWISIDGTTGEVYEGQLPTVVPDVDDPHLSTLLGWADEVRTLSVWANADYPKDAERARRYGAEGIGLCRTEHMFFESDRLPIVQDMVMARTPTDRRAAIDKLLPLQRADFEGLFRAMDGKPVIIRLLDPPLHEFLPTFEDLVQELADLKVQLQHHTTMSDIDRSLAKIRKDQDYLDRVASLREQNPMLGTRGVRLGILIPELSRMQVRAIFEAAIRVSRDGVAVKPEVMIPLVSDVRELEIQRTLLEAEATEVMEEQGLRVPHKFGTMIEVPRAALTADELAESAEFFSFGTNDLTQTTYGISRDDAEQGFLLAYIEQGVLPSNPFATIDPKGVGQLMALAVRKGRSVRPDLEVGICGEHGGDPDSIDLCHRLGLDYVSCSPFRVPIARLAAAQAALRMRD